jgi:hypothetical protein
MGLDGCHDTVWADCSCHHLLEIYCIEACKIPHAYHHLNRTVEFHHLLQACLNSRHSFEYQHLAISRYLGVIEKFLEAFVIKLRTSRCIFRPAFISNLQPVWLSSTLIQNPRMNLRLDRVVSSGTAVSVSHVGRARYSSIG